MKNSCLMKFGESLFWTKLFIKHFSSLSNKYSSLICFPLYFINHVLISNAVYRKSNVFVLQEFFKSKALLLTNSYHTWIVCSCRPCCFKYTILNIRLVFDCVFDKAAKRLSNIWSNTIKLKKNNRNIFQQINPYYSRFVWCSSDFWRCLKLSKENPIKKLHITPCKQILGVQKQTTNTGLLLELGRITPDIYANIFAIILWAQNKGFGVLAT